MITEVAAFGHVLDLAGGQEGFIDLLGWEIEEMGFLLLPFRHIIQDEAEVAIDSLLFFRFACSGKEHMASREDLLRDSRELLGNILCLTVIRLDKVCQEIIERHAGLLRELCRLGEIGCEASHGEIMPAGEGGHIPFRFFFQEKLLQPFRIPEGCMIDDFSQQVHEPFSL